jgi:hypothetical protein
MEEYSKYCPNDIYWNGNKYIFMSNVHITNIQKCRNIFKNCIIGDPCIYGIREMDIIQFAKNVSEARDMGLYGVYVINKGEAFREFDTYLNKYI